MGTGPGFTARHLIEFFDVYVVGVDTSSFQLERAKRASAAALKTGRLRLLQADIERERLELLPYDGAISQAVFFHLGDRDSALRNVAAAEKGARFVLDDLLITEDVTAREFREAFGRLGSIRLERESIISALSIDRCSQ